MRQPTSAVSQGNAGSHIKTMKSPLHGGKTPPRFLRDLSRYNPHRPPSSSYNVLTQLSLQFEGSPLPRAKKGSCQHKWALKLNQSTLPDLDVRPDYSSFYNAAAYCISCRCHVDVSIDYRGEGPGVLPCPKEDAPLHHFVYLSNAFNGRRAIKDAFNSGPWVDIQHFQCSSLSCSARLITRFRPPRLTSEWAALLVDRSLIKERAQKVMEDEPARFEGHPVPSPIQVLVNLRAYISNAMQSPDSRRIIGNNKKWLLCFGEPCTDLIKYLGFTREGDDWMPPRPDAQAITPFTNPVNVLLDDVDKELLVLLDQQPEDEKRMAKVYFSSTLASVDFERILGSRGYKKSAASRTVDLTNEDEEHPFYAGLGAIGDFHDDLLSFAYDRQIEYDPQNTPYYLECLQGIAKGRRSEELEVKVAVEASSGKISLKDVREAYQSFGLEFHSEYMDDDIIGNFQARVADSPKQEAELRRALHVIGQHRSSERIQQIAANSVTTYEQALAWLNASEDTDDGWLVSMYGAKVGENPSNQELARSAIALIAQKRNSNVLRLWLETGQLGEVEMDIGQAYARLGIDDRTVDDDTILQIYNLRAQDTPSQIDDLKRALTAIAKSKESHVLQNFLSTGMVTSEHSPAQWPVGLGNIGNTCYLNSLLQFYFTIKPLRDLVLNFDDYKMQPEDIAFNKKQVGSRRVSPTEIERAQRFMYELRKLFQSMIAIPKAQVVPEQELARLTLISSIIEVEKRRQSMLSSDRPSLGDIHGKPIQGPLPPPKPQDITNMDIEPSHDGPDASNTATSHDDEVSSEGTLVDAPMLHTEVMGDNDFMIVDSDEKQQQQQQQILDNKENLPPFKENFKRPSTPENHLRPLGESSPSRVNEQRHETDPTRDSGKDHEMSMSKENTPSVSFDPPSRAPPPIPPRQRPEEQKKAIQEEVEMGAQQDVGEVIGNVLFQLQCAIKAQSIDESGEQIDQVKNLFFGKLKSYTTNEKGVIRTKEEFISDIKVDVASGPRDIYSALDGAFDVQEVEVGGSLEPQYTTISQLPPVLQIMVQRAQFDPETKTTVKSNNHLGLREIIYMDRYIDSADPELQHRRQECWNWKRDLATLQARKLELTQTELGIDIPEAITATRGYLDQLKDIDQDDPIEVKPELLQNLEQISKKAKVELLTLDEQIKSVTTNINSQFADLRDLPYRLHSVFIHRGRANTGHYWIYIYDFARSMWRKYNDEYVTEVKDPDVEIYGEEKADYRPTPYFLVYIRDEFKDQLVDAVCRDIVAEAPFSIPEEEGSSQDTIMVDDEDAQGTEELVRWHGGWGGEGTVDPRATQKDLYPDVGGGNGNGQWNSRELHTGSNVQW